jgi:hypothetical protein
VLATSTQSGNRRTEFPVEDEYGVTRLDEPVDVEPAWAPSMV